MAFDIKKYKSKFPSINAYGDHSRALKDYDKEIDKINRVTKDNMICNICYEVINDNQYILFYVLEKYTKNIPLLEKFLKIHVKNYENPTINKLTSEKYKDFKNKIQLDNAYKNKLLNTKIMQYFYSNEDIIKIYNMY